MDLELIIRFDYGSIVPWVRKVGGRLLAIGGPEALSFWSPVDTHGVGLTPIDALRAVDGTTRWWEEW